MTLPDEIVSSDPGRVRALIVSGGNPTVAVPGKARMVEALSSLDLLVTVDPYMSETALLADYVIAPLTHLERPDTTRAYESLMDQPFAQHTPAIVPPPPGLIDDWELFLRLTWAMGSSLRVAGREYAVGSPMPSTDEVLAAFAARARVPLDEVKQHPHGHRFDAVEPVRAAPPTDGASGVFDIAPADVEDELVSLAGRLRATALAGPTERDHGRMLLIVRRAKEMMNSSGTQLAALVRDPANPCHMHPDDLGRLGLVHGSAVSLTSDHGSIDAVVHADATLRSGVVSMTHGFGGPGVDGDPPGSGSSTNRLLSPVDDLQAVSGMPQLTAVPVTVAAVPTSRRGPSSTSS